MFKERHLDVSIDKSDIWIQIDEDPELLRFPAGGEYKKFMVWLADKSRKEDVEKWFPDLVEFFKFVVTEHKEITEPIV